MKKSSKNWTGSNGRFWNGEEGLHHIHLLHRGTQKQGNAPYDERSNGRVLMEKNRFNSPGNPSGFEPNLYSLVENGSRLQNADGHVEKDATQCGEEICPNSRSLSKSSTNTCTLSLKLKLIVQKTKKPNSPVSTNGTEGLFNLLQKAEVTPSGSSFTVNLMQTMEQRLSKSGRSPGVVHMQMIHHKYRRRKFNIHDNSRDGKSNKWKMSFGPSPGAGH